LLYTQVNPDLGPVFDDSQVPRIDISIHSDSLAWILNDENLESNALFHADFFFDNGSFIDTVYDVGFRLRGNTSRNADKKSFKIDFNHFESGRKFYGLEKMNLNGQHNDPSISRAKICSDIAYQMDIPTLRTNHVRLFINNEFRGVYLNVEHIDEEYIGERFYHETGNLYKCLYPADLNYKGNDPDLYKEVFWGRRAYTQKNNKVVEKYDDLAQFIDIINNSSDENFQCELESIFNADSYLKFIVFDILTGNWDGPIYNKNNFYLYYDDLKNRFEYIPFDLDNTIGIDWLNRDWGDRNIYEWSQGGENRPLYERIMENENLRNRFTYYMEEALQTVFTEDNLYPYLDEMKSKILPFVEEDVFYSQDYGFSMEDFQESFEFGDLPYYQTDYNLKAFIDTRRNEALNQLENTAINPIIKNFNSNLPDLTESWKIQVSLNDDTAIMNAECCYTFENGAEICSPLLDNGMSNDYEASDGIYGTILPPFGETGIVRYYLKVTDINSNLSYFPSCESNELFINSEIPGLVINELSPKNDDLISDEYADYDDWIELYNVGNSPISLADKFLTTSSDKLDRFPLPNVIIQPDSYVLIWADDDNEQGKWHANFNLAAALDSLYLTEYKETGIAIVDYTGFQDMSADNSWARIPNGVGPFTFHIPSPLAQNDLTKTNENSLSHIEIYPNPAREYIKVTSELDLFGQCTLIDIHGKIISKPVLLHNTAWLDIAALLPGIYIVQCSFSDGTSISKKFVKI